MLLLKLKELKVAIDNKDSKIVAEIIVAIYIDNPKSFKKSLLLSNSLPEPLARGTNDEKMKLLIESFTLAIGQMVNKSIDIVDFTKEFMQIITVINIIYYNSKSNMERLNKNSFSDFTVSKQLQMFCIYIEDQNRIINLQKSPTLDFMTGMERNVANHGVTNNESLKVSLSDNFEALIEIADTLFRLLYFKAGKQMEKNQQFLHEGISPYEIGSFEEVMHLAFQRNLLDLMWGKFKYRDWKLSFAESDNKKIHIFEPISKENFKKERIAVMRYNYRDHIQTQQEYGKNLKENQNAYHDLADLVRKLNLKTSENLFEIKKNEFIKAKKFIENIMKAQERSLAKVYFNIKYDGLKIEEVLAGFEYLFTIATIYQQSILSTFNDDDITQYIKLSPILDKNYFVKHFNSIYDFGLQKAERVINNFVFSKDSKLDVFSQPLIYVGQEKVVFCPTLIMQMNIVRIIEMLATELEIDISDKGNEFERNLRFILSFNSHILVNQNKVEFMAFDGRDIEYDFIGLFEEHLLIIEFKHQKVPYSDKTHKSSLDNINFGVEQVKRRVDVLKHDWSKLKQQCSFKLPDEPIEDNKIIKLVCTNIFDHSTLVIDGVKIIDSSSLLKFFMSPELKGIVTGDKVEEVFSRKIWKESYPSVGEFKEFLKSPIAVQPFVDSFEEQYKPIEIIEEDDNRIMFFDYILSKDPYEEMYKELIIPLPTNAIKIGRNDPCPCKSGKKFKRCCGL